VRRSRDRAIHNSTWDNSASRRLLMYPREPRSILSRCGGGCTETHGYTVASYSTLRQY
jgi:hypothetical protein